MSRLHRQCVIDGGRAGRAASRRVCSDQGGTERHDKVDGRGLCGADGIRCNALCPSSVLTPNLDQLIDELPNSKEVIEFRNAINLLGYTATPDQVASAVVFLASPGAAFMTGGIVPVSGRSECGYRVKFVSRTDFYIRSWRQGPSMPNPIHKAD